MRVYYTPNADDPNSGVITHTIAEAAPVLLARMTGSYIEVETIDGDLGSYEVQAGQLVVILAAAKSAQSALIDASYYAASTASVSFTSAGGVTQTFQADDNDGEKSSQAVLLKSFTIYKALGGVPADFYWKAEDNTKVPFTLADLQGLYNVMITQGWVAFDKRTILKEQIEAAADLAAVQAVTWESAT